MSYVYQDPSMSQEMAATLLASSEEQNVIVALVSIGLNEPDGPWAQDTCIKFLNGPSEAIIATAIVALGHVARRIGKIDMNAAASALAQVKNRYPNLEGTISDFMDDIELFT